MAITKIAEPNQYHPGFNPIWYYFDSTNKNQPGFKYIVELYYKGTNTLIKSFEMSPRPNDGYCEINIQNTINKLLTYDSVNPTLTIPVLANNNRIEYDIKVKEKFVTTWTYLDYEFRTTGVWEAYTILTTNPTSGPTSSATHNYQVGDQINNLQSDGGVLKPALQGLHTVVEVIDNRSIVIDVPWWQVGSGAAVSGVTSFADGRSTTTGVLSTTSNRVVFSSGYQFEDFISYTQSMVLPTIGTQSAKFLSNVPDYFRLSDDQKFNLNFFTGDLNDGTIELMSDDGTKVTTGVTFGTASNIWRIDCGSDFVGGTLQSGTGSLIKPTTKWWAIRLVDLNDDALTEWKYFSMNRDICNPVIIYFVDRMGSLGSFYFPFKNSIENTNDKQSYTRLIGGIQSGQYNYNTTDIREKVYDVNSTRIMSLLSDYLTTSEANYFEELITTHTAYIKYPDDANYYYIKVTGEPYKTYIKNNEKVKQYPIKVELPKNNINI